MKMQSSSLFTEIDIRFFEWAVSQQEALGAVTHFLSNASESQKEAADFIEVRTLESAFPVIGKTHALTLMKYTGSEPTPVESWYEFCRLAKLTGDLPDIRIRAVHAGPLAIVTACMIHAQKTLVLPYEKCIVALFPRDRHTDCQASIYLKLRSDNGQERLTLGHSNSRPITPGDIIASLWEIPRPLA